MKKAALVIFSLLFFHLTAVSQPCLPQGIEFTTQTEIDNFQVNYPNCTEIEGKVFIGGGSNNINNLNGLSVLTSFGGDLHISSTSLTSLTGLNAVTFIGGKLQINDSPLTDLTGLNALTTIGGDFQIIYMHSLISLTGLDSLVSVGGNISIGSSYYLTSTAGLGSLTTIGGGLDLEALFSLTNLTGLEALTSIGGALYITAVGLNPDLTGLNSLTSIGGALVIRNSHGISSLSGLDQLEASTIDYLQIIYNDTLTTCAIQSVCDYLANPGGTIEIHDNATGCNSQQEVEDSCAALSVDDFSDKGRFLIYPNPSSTKITIETSEITNQSHLSITNLNGQELISKQITERKTVIDIKNQPGGIYFVRFTNEMTVAVRMIIKQ